MWAKQVRGQGNEKDLQPDMEAPDLDGYKGSGPNRVCAHGRIRGGCGGLYYAGRGQQYQQDIQQDIECDVGGLYPELARRLAAVRLRPTNAVDSDSERFFQFWPRSAGSPTWVIPSTCAESPRT
jgi:hypothetical protein